MVIVRSARGSACFWDEFIMIASLGRSAAGGWVRCVRTGVAMLAAAVDEMCENRSGDAGCSGG